ncbi:MAG: hypothetical protein OXD30_08150 [Bryobacterales bacterium]|nr:hypothetical protein [Bryobacterales bacterium]
MMARAERAAGAASPAWRRLGPHASRRLLLVVGLVAGWFLLVLAKLVVLQVLQHEQLSARALRQHASDPATTPFRSRWSPYH